MSYKRSAAWVADRADSEIAPEISWPMLDLHAPDESIHTGKSCFIPIATLIIGPLFAVGLEQPVRLFHRYHLHKLPAGLPAEAEANVARNAINLRHFDLDMS